MSVATTSWYAFNKATTGGESVTGNAQGDTLIIQVYGSATAVNLQILGQVDGLSTAWSPLNAINMTTLEVGTSITSPGIYVVAINGCSRIKTKLNSVSGGEVSVYGRITKEQ